MHESDEEYTGTSSSDESAVNQIFARVPAGSALSKDHVDPRNSGNAKQGNSSKREESPAKKQQDSLDQQTASAPSSANKKRGSSELKVEAQLGNPKSKALSNNTWQRAMNQIRRSIDSTSRTAKANIAKAKPMPIIKNAEVADVQPPAASKFQRPQSRVLKTSASSSSMNAKSILLGNTAKLSQGKAGPSGKQTVAKTNAASMGLSAVQQNQAESRDQDPQVTQNQVLTQNAKDSSSANVLLAGTSKRILPALQTDTSTQAAQASLTKAPSTSHGITMQEAQRVQLATDIAKEKSSSMTEMVEQIMRPGEGPVDMEKLPFYKRMVARFSPTGPVSSSEVRVPPLCRSPELIGIEIISSHKLRCLAQK